MRKQYVVRMPEEERASLLTMIGRGAAPARAQTHARILLKANQGEAGPEWTDGAISTALDVDRTTVARHPAQSSSGARPAPLLAAEPRTVSASWASLRPLPLTPSG